MSYIEDTRMKRVLSGAALVVIVFVCIASYGSGGRRKTIPAEGSDPPTDTTRAWVDPSSYALYHYSTTAGLWLAPLPAFVGKNGTGVTGALGVFATGMSCDTTTAGAVGISAAMDSTVLVGLSWWSRRTSPPASPNCTTQVYRCRASGGGPTLVNQSYWGATETGDSLFATKLFFGPGEPIAVYLKPAAAGAVNPAYPQVDLGLYRFRRKS